MAGQPFQEGRALNQALVSFLPIPGGLTLVAGERFEFKNLQILGVQNRIANMQALWIDNSANAGKLSVFNPKTFQYALFPPKSAGWAPMLIATDAGILVFTLSTVSGNIGLTFSTYPFEGIVGGF